MKRRVFSLAFTILVSCAFLARPASATPISLAPAVEGTALGGEAIDLTVSFDLNDSIATNLVGVELYVAFTGLTPVAGSYVLGDVFAPVLSDDPVLANGLCSDPITGCSYPTSDPDHPSSSQHYLSYVSIFAPSVVTGPGTLFTLRFTAPAGNWSLNLFGDDQTALLWDPPPTCDPADLNCAEIPAPIPFAIVLPGTDVASGTARVDVGVTVTSPPPPTVPEPATFLLMGSGLACAAVRQRALRRRPYRQST